MKKSLLTLFCFICFIVTATAQYDLTVAQDGTGNYTTVQAAINAAPTGRVAAYKIFIKKGKYSEKISIPSNKPFIFLIGEDVGTVTLTWNDYSGKPIPGGGVYGTSNSASVTFNAPDCGAVNITFENSTGDAPQALAINVNATRCAFKNCRFLGGQDTVLTNGNGNMQYFRNCYIDGVVDFIFGAAIAVFDSCTIYPKTRLDGLSGSYLTAANTPSGQTYGYVFRDCVIPANRGTTSYVMGRPWQNDGTTSPVSNTKVIFLNTTMSSSIKPQGWDVWNVSTNTALITYGEYRSRKFDSSLVDVSQRVAWSQQLTDVQAVTYTNANIFGSWDPCAALTEICTYTPKPLVTSNFKGVKGAVNSTFTWNISWPISNVKYEIFRSTNRVVFAKVAEQTSTNDTAVNYNYAEAIPPAGTTYYYYVWSSKIGLTTNSSDTIAISSTPTITATGSMGGFLQGLGTPSASQSYSVSAVNLTNNLVITAPPSFEISNNGGTNWNTSSTPITLTPDGTGNIAATTISVRLNAIAAGSYSDNILHVSTGAVSVNMPVTGTVQSTRLATSNILLQWPLTIANTDSSSIRDAGVTASTPSFAKLYSSNGTTVPAVTAYSTTYGMAYGATANGDGSWGTAAGGPGGTLNRTFYSQFTITAAAGNTVRVDSFILNSSFYNTSSNTKMAVLYSKTGFTTNDSTEVSGGIGSDGLSLAAGANGAFLTPVLLGNETAGTTLNYRFALNGSTGVTLNAGQTLTLRVYNTCGSSSAGRYCKIKNAYFKGLSSGAVPVTLTSFNASLENSFVKTTWITTNEINVASFILERSNDGFTYNTLGSIVAKNNTGTNNYTLTDVNAINGIAYYRLKIIDKDGSFKYSKVIVVNNKLKNQLTVYPNPASNEITVNYIKANSNSTIAIASIDGRNLITHQLIAGTTQTTIDISKLSSGTYFLTINGIVEKNTIKFIKE
jgi:pectinesterase